MSAVSALGEVNSPGTPPPPLRLPRTDIFGHRARRFAELAPGHPLESYLVFMMALAEGQQHLAEAEELFAAADHELSLRLYCEGRPPLVIQHWPRARTWQHAFQRLLVAMAPHAPMATRGVIDALLGADPEDLETMATRALRGADPLRDPRG